MSKKLNQVLDSIRLKVREGKLAEARPELLALCKRRRIPRGELPRISHLARLCYLPEESIRLLGPFVRPPRGAAPQATDEEMGEYGMALATLGAGAEAVKLLSPLDLKKVPWVFFGLTLAYFRLWNWKGALPLIQGFLARNEINQGERLHASLDLAAALLHGNEDFETSQSVLEKLIHETQGKDYAWLHAEALMMLAQVYLTGRDAERALATIERVSTEATAVPPGSPLDLRIQMMRAGCGLITSGDRAAAIRDLNACEVKFKQARLWVRVREIDFLKARFLKDDQAVWRLYFGVGLAGARERILKVSGKSEKDVPSFFDWRVGGGSGAEAPFFHVQSGENSLNPRARLKEGQIIQRTLQALTLDLYAPAESFALFERIYPGEIYNSSSSLLKVRQGLWQLRRWLQSNRIPLVVTEADGAYKLEAECPLNLRLAPGMAPDPAASGDIRLKGLSNRAEETYGNRWFSASEFALLSDLSERSAQRFIKMGLQRNLFEFQGIGPSRRYRVKAD